MNTLKLTAKHFKDTDNYWKEYVGKEDVSNYEGHIEIEAGLGYVRFVSLAATGSIVAAAGSGIEAGWGIEAGEGIEAGWGIKAGSGIEAGEGIKAGWGIKAGSGIVSFYSWIKAKLSITARLTISAGIFSLSGAHDVEAQEIAGNLIFGNKKLLPKPEPESPRGSKTVKIRLTSGQTLEGELIEDAA